MDNGEQNSPPSNKPPPSNPNPTIKLNSPPPDTPNSAPIPPSTFYGQPTSRDPPPLPSRPKKVGSSFTKASFVPESAQARPPHYMSDEGVPYREPELVEAWQDPGPGVLTDVREPSQWESDQSWTLNADPSWGANNDSGIWIDSHLASSKIKITNRDEFEELNWWNPLVRTSRPRPGPGYTPGVIADKLHDPYHTLLSVVPSLPNIKPAKPTASTTSSPPESQPPSTPQNAPDSTESRPEHPPQPPPTIQELREAVPHPNAYYCRSENSWILLSWQTSTILPPLAKRYLSSSNAYPLPDHETRRRVGSCTSSESSNHTHHFHHYEKAFDSLDLQVSFRRSEWQKTRSQKPPSSESNRDSMQVDDVGELMDLFICCQCSLFCVVSDSLPGVISKQDMDTFIQDKRNNPAVGSTPERATVAAMENLLKIIENKLWRDEHRQLRVTKPRFVRTLGVNGPVLQHILASLGFLQSQLEDGEQTWVAPSIDLVTPEGRHNRAKLLRGWIELSAWLADFLRHNKSRLESASLPSIWVTADVAREEYQTAIGAHPDQLPRGGLDEKLHGISQAYWDTLGITRSTYTPELLSFSYFAQVRCDPARTVDYFNAFYNIVDEMGQYSLCPPELQSIVMEERERGRFTVEDLSKAPGALGFGDNGPLRIEYDSDVSDEFIENAYHDALKRAWREGSRSSELQREAKEALGRLADSRSSERLKNLWKSSDIQSMDPEKAYGVLEVPMDVDEAMLLVVYDMRIQESPYQKTRLREALSVIAEVRDSNRLRQFLTSGSDPGDIVAPTRPDLPRGLNQLGNTCYLNSLLQYFYTIKELREIVLQINQAELKTIEDDKLTDADIKRHRVGGRLVTRREIARSRKFVNQLAELFVNLQHSEEAAVTPTVSLAKLALVTSRDEEEDEADKGGTDASNDTEATLVDDGQPQFTLVGAQRESPTPSTGSVLGKRVRDLDRQDSAMVVDNVDDKVHTGDLITSSNSGSSPVASAPSQPASGSRENADVDMHDSPPRLERPSSPPPPPTLVRKPTADDGSTMMFGKQHDVAECMDNCMFQIETALLKFEGVEASTDNGKTSIVKRLFYGTIRQRLAPFLEDSKSKSSIHEKQDLFSHLPVNVMDDGIDIYDGLSGYFDDVVEFQDKKARMEVSLVDLPPLLQIQLQRVQFNRETLQPYKSQAYVKFDETIQMDRFLDSADPHKKSKSRQLQRDLRDCRERIRVLDAGKNSPYATSLANTSGYLGALKGLAIEGIDHIDEALPQALKTEAGAVKAELETLRSQADQLKSELESLWKTDSPQATYELTSVFIHRGSSPSFGHYFFYSRHLPGNPDSWFKYNDSDVSVVTKEEVLADTTGSTANPYLLVFARKGLEVIDTVKRLDGSTL